MVRRGPDGVPYQAPQVGLLFKAKLGRDKDEGDLSDCWPRLDDDARRWLREALELTSPGHPWSARLTVTRAGRGRDPVEAQGHGRAGVPGAGRVAAEVVGHPAVGHHGVAPLVEADQLGQHLGAQPVPGTARPVDDQPLRSAAGGQPGHQRQLPAVATGLCAGSGATGERRQVGAPPGPRVLLDVVGEDAQRRPHQPGGAVGVVARAAAGHQVGAPVQPGDQVRQPVRTRSADQCRDVLGEGREAVDAGAALARATRQPASR